MICRGTRLCPDLFGPNDNKKKFYIFDVCGNFEYFENNPPKAGGGSMSLNEKLFLNRLELAEKIKDDEEKLKIFSSKIKDNLHNLVKTMNRENFIVRNYIESVEKFSNREKWDNLDDIDFLKIKNEIAKLPAAEKEDKELAKRFDLIIVNMQLALYSKSAKLFLQYENKIKIIANLLEQKSSIPIVRKNIELIEELQKDEYWKNITIPELEEIRIKLRDLIDLLDFQKQEIVYTNFEDEINEQKNANTDTPQTAGVDMAQYRKKVEAFLQEHQNEIAINKLKHNKPLTPLDVEQLEKILKENADILGTEDKFKSLMGNLGLGEFIRSVIGLDNEEIEKVFAQYLDVNNFNANQIRFIDKIISYLKINGTMLDIGTLYEAPFTDLNAEGIDGMFSSKDADNIIYLIKEINNNAKISM